MGEDPLKVCLFRANAVVIDALADGHVQVEIVALGVELWVEEEGGD